MLKSAVAFICLLATIHLAKGQVTFIIESLPPSTKNADTIFICGTFNNWVPNDKRYIVQKQLNGQLSVVIPRGTGEVEYKFTRGDWVRVETDAGNKMISNRKFHYGNGETVYVKIDNWLDQGGARSLNYIVLYFFACAFQGIALCLLTFKIQRRDPEKFKAFILITSWLIFLLLLLVVLEFSDPIWQSYFIFVFHFGLFCLGSTVLLFLHFFLKVERRFYKFYFIVPLAVALPFAVIQFFNFNWFSFLSQPILAPLTVANLLFIGAGFIYNAFLFVKMKALFPSLALLPNRDELNKKDIFANSVYWISLAIILLVPLNVFILGYIDNRPFFEDFHLIGLAFTALIFLEAIFIWRFPEILKESKAPSPAEDTSEWPVKLDNLMKAKKPYRNPELSVADLSEMLGTKSHVLSKVINEHYEKNFRDFVNKYRVEEFIALANTEEFKHYTFLALAQEVGFNSKSTFNLAFKKVTNQNPRDYFKSREAEE